MAARTCTEQFGGLCTNRSGHPAGSPGRMVSLRHQCGETVLEGEDHPARDSPHVCTACSERSPKG